jgi:hypothetical protein
MIVRLAADGAVVQDADECGRLHLETDLDEAKAGIALKATGTGELVDADTALLDLGVLRSRAQLLVSDPQWSDKWEAMVAYAEREGWLSEDGRSVQVHVER